MISNENKKKIKRGATEKNITEKRTATNGKIEIETTKRVTLLGTLAVSVALTMAFRKVKLGKNPVIPQMSRNRKKRYGGNPSNIAMEHSGGGGEKAVKMERKKVKNK